MAEVDKDWIKKQMSKAVSAEESVLKAERDHRERLADTEFAGMYDQIIREDEAHLDHLKRIGEKYGYEPSGVMETAGMVAGGVKSVTEAVTTSDPFQTIGDDLMMKSNALNYDLAWTKIFRDIGDTDSATIMQQAAEQDERHQGMMRDSLTNVGLREAHGERVKED